MGKPPYLSEQKRNSRIVGVHLLYMWLFHKLDIKEILDVMLKPTIAQGDLGVGDFDKEYVNTVLLGVEKHHATIIEEISKYLDINWRFERLGKLPQIILSLATYELCFFKDIKKGIIISEYMIIAKKFNHEGETGFLTVS